MSSLHATLKRFIKRFYLGLPVLCGLLCVSCFKSLGDETTPASIKNLSASSIYAGDTSSSLKVNATCFVNNEMIEASYSSAMTEPQMVTGICVNGVVSLSLPIASGTVNQVFQINTKARRSNRISKTVSMSFNYSPTNSTYGGIISVSAFGDAPHAPAGTPTARQITVLWPAFSGATTNSVYSLIRTTTGSSLDLKTNTACTAGILSSCVVCTKTGLGSQSCTDTNIAAAPQKYDYAITDAQSMGQIPTRLTVAVPPTNMVLVQRDSANYEMCRTMGRTPDPFKFNRCPYSGLGGVPYNSNPGNAPLNLSGNYYDVGYSFFVDRWLVGCHWSPAAAGGHCGAGAILGDCFGTAAPATTIGTVGNIFYNTANGSCYVKDISSNWLAIGSASPSQAQRTLASTTDPSPDGAPIPTLGQLDQPTSYDTCQSLVDPNYGPKRLPRQREQIVLAAPLLPEEPGALDDTGIQNLENGLNLPVTHACNANTHDGFALSAATAFPLSELSGDTGGSLGSVNLGSTLTKNCVSRYGVQDYVGNLLQWTSDQLAFCDNTTNTCLGQTSPMDSGNTDFNGISFDGIQAPGNQFIFVLPLDGVTASAANFSVPLSLPLVSSDGGNAMSIPGAWPTTKFHGDVFTINTGNVGVHGHYTGGFWADGDSTGRWKSLFHASPTQVSAAVGFRCILPSE